MPDTTPLVKERGELKEAHETRLAATALPMFDIHAYVDDFGASIVPAASAGTPTTRAK